MKNIVIYHNDINKIPLRNLTDKELNLFFSLIFKAKEKGVNNIEIEFSELRKISNGDINNPRFINSIKTLNRKLLDLKQEIELSNGDYLMFNLFNKFLISTQRKVVEIKINQEFYYMINELIGSYTKFELEQLVSFKSSYSKNLFRILKQWESIEVVNIDIKEFKRILCIPDSYRICDIDNRVIKPILIELVGIFPNLKLEKIKKGRSIKSLKFTWNKNARVLEKPKETFEIRISRELNNAFEVAKKNKFLKKILTSKNMIILIKKYKEEDLIKAIYSVYKEVKKEIRSIKYIEKSIDNYLDQEIKIVVVDDLEEKPKTEKIRRKANICDEYFLLSEEEKEKVEVKAMKIYIKESKIEKMTKIQEKIYSSVKSHYINLVLEK